MNKIGIHLIGDDFNPSQLCSPSGIPPRVVKLVDPSIDFLRRVRAAVGQDCLIIVRWVEPTLLDKPAARAQEWFDRHIGQMYGMSAYGARIAFEGYNEVPDSQCAEYCLFEYTRLSLMQSRDLRSVVGNFSVGTPDLPVWAAYVPMLNAMSAGDWLGLHEYWSNRNDLTNPWHAGRWRLVPELVNIPIIVTECGRDRVENAGESGWRKTCGADEFLGDLRQYNSLLEEEFPRVLGACVFTGGRIYSQWWDFDVNDIWGRVIMEYTDRSPKPQPGPEQPVQPPENPKNQRPVVGIPLIDEIRMPIQNLQKAWYEASVVYGPYDGHPERAQDWNLETGGNTDLGEPLVAPFSGLVVHAAQYGGGYGRIIGIVGVTSQGELIYWQGRHLKDMLVEPGQIVWVGDPIGSIGNADGRYAGAHLHEQICVGEVPGATQDWQNVRYNFVQPSTFYVEHGVDQGLVERMRRWDGK